MENRSQKLFNSLLKYYTDDKLQILVDITNTSNEHNGNVSLRLIDWLVTNYSKSHNVIYYLDGKPFNLHQNYKNMLKAYSKRLFDPFRRHSRVFIKCPVVEDDVLETTVAQLTFFKWAIDSGVLYYANNNKTLIKNDMDLNSKGRTTYEKTDTIKVHKSAKIFKINFNVTFS